MPATKSARKSPIGEYVPDRGDIIYINFDSQCGREIMKRRPALVLSTLLYNRATNLCIVCPLSSQVKGRKIEVPITHKGKKGVVKADQIKSLDWKIRHAEKAGKAAAGILSDVQNIVLELIAG